MKTAGEQGLINLAAYFSTAYPNLSLVVTNLFFTKIWRERELLYLFLHSVSIFGECGKSRPFDGRIHTCILYKYKKRAARVKNGGKFDAENLTKMRRK